MIGLGPRLGRLLRSRKLAFWLIVVLSIWSLLGTLFPQGGRSPAGFQSKLADIPELVSLADAIGLDKAFSAPLFLAAVGLLFLSTIVCAWDRTRLAIRDWRSHGRVTPAAAERVIARSAFSIPVRIDAEAARVLEDVALGFEAVGLGAKRGEVLVEGSVAPWRLLASPVFHWSLVVLMALFAIGGLTRFEGLIGVPVGTSLPDVPESYRTSEAGPLFSGHTGLSIAVDDLVVGFREGGVNRGPAPTVTVSGDRGVLASQRVYPNHPLRHGPIMVHMEDYGLAFDMVLADSDGTEVVRELFLVDFDEAQPSGTVPTAVALERADGKGNLSATVELWPTTAERTSSEIRLKVSDEDSRTLVDARPVEGERTRVPGSGVSLAVENVRLYARLGLVNDWTVAPIYVAFAVMVVAVSAALLMPYRVARAKISGEGQDRELHVWVRRSADEAVFVQRVQEAVSRSLAGRAASDEEGAKHGS